jgi:hypothetical protein
VALVIFSAPSAVVLALFAFHVNFVTADAWFRTTPRICFQLAGTPERCLGSGYRLEMTQPNRERNKTDGDDSENDFHVEIRFHWNLPFVLQDPAVSQTDPTVAPNFVHDSRLDRANARFQPRRAHSLNIKKDGTRAVGCKPWLGRQPPTRS